MSFKLKGVVSAVSYREYSQESMRRLLMDYPSSFTERRTWRYHRRMFMKRNICLDIEFFFLPFIVERTHWWRRRTSFSRFRSFLFGLGTHWKIVLHILQTRKCAMGSTRVGDVPAGRIPLSCICKERYLLSGLCDAAGKWAHCAVLPIC